MVLVCGVLLHAGRVAGQAPPAPPQAASEGVAASLPVEAAEQDEAAPAPPPRNHAEAVGWDQKHEVTDQVYFQPGRGLTAESRDGLFKLSIGLRGQFRYDMDKVDGARPTQSFTLRRARFTLTGHWWGEDNIFKMELAISPQDLGMTPALGAGNDDNPVLSGRGVRVTRSPLLDLYTQFRQLRDLNVRVGQYKIPFSRQRVVSSGSLVFVDRSIVNGEFNLDRDLGFDIRSMDFLGLGGRLRYYAGLYTGEGHSSFSDREVSRLEHFFGLNALVRVEVLPLGGFDDYVESDLERTPRPRISLGGAFAYVGQAQGERGVLGDEPEDQGTTNFLVGEADAVLKWRGFTVQTEFMIRHGKRNADGDPAMPLDPPRDGWGLTGQLAYLTPVNFELAARQSAIRARGESSLSPNNETAVALGYYLAGHPYKIQGDFTRYYADDIRDGEYLMRVQLQLSL